MPACVCASGCLRVSKCVRTRVIALCVRACMRACACARSNSPRARAHPNFGLYVRVCVRAHLWCSVCLHVCVYACTHSCAHTPARGWSRRRMRVAQCGEVSADRMKPEETRARCVSAKACSRCTCAQTHTRAQHARARADARVRADTHMGIDLGAVRAEGGVHGSDLGRARQPVEHVWQRAAVVGTWPRRSLWRT